MMNTSNKPQPNWHPISMLPVIRDIIESQLESSLEMYGSFKEAEHRPQVLDDHNIERSLKLYSEQLEDHWVIEEQLSRWSRGDLTPSQKKEIERLQEQLVKLKESNEAIVALLNKMKDHTIDKIMDMDDAELGLKFLMGEMPDPFAK